MATGSQTARHVISKIDRLSTVRANVGVKMQSDTQNKQSPANNGRSVHYWEVAERQIVITARSGLAGAIWQDVVERGPAACGFLLGKMLDSDAGQCLYLEALMPLDLKITPGSSELPDLGQFGARMSRWQQAAKGRASWAGCYVVRAELDELESTLLPALYGPLFTTPIAAVLVLVPGAAGCECRMEVISPSIATGVIPEFQFSLREFADAEPGSNIADTEHPFVIEAPVEFSAAAAASPIETVGVKDEKVATATAVEAPVESLTLTRLAVVAERIVPEAPVAPLRTMPPPVKTPGFRRWLWVLLALLAGGGGAILAVRLWRLTELLEPGRLATSPVTTGTTATSKLDLQVARRGNDLELTWNRSSVALVGNASGTLRINDGGSRNEILLDGDQLRNGRILYVPRTGDVEVSLQIKTAGGGTEGDTLRVLQPGFGPHTTSSGPAPTAPTVQVPLQRNPSPTGTAQRTLPAAVKPAPREFVLPPVAGGQPRSGVTGTIRVEPATLESHLNGLQNPVLPIASSSGGPSVAPPPVTPRRQPQPVTPQPVTPQPITPPATGGAKEQAGTRPAPVPAVPIQRVRLSIPQELRSRLPSEITIDVELTLDAQGRVTDARPERQATAAGTELAGMAAANARLWQFQAATVGGLPVASKYVLTFHFKR